MPHAPVRVLIASPSEARSAEIAAFLPRPRDVDLAGSAEAALEGLAGGRHDLVVIDRALARPLAALAGAGPAPQPDDDPSLTEQERVVLALMRRHLTYKEIAQHLGVSWHTVRTHAQSILRKRGVHSRRDLDRPAPWAVPAAEAANG